MQDVDLVADAAGNALELNAGSEEFFIETRDALKLYASEAASVLDPEDRPIVFAPVFVFTDGKARPGAVCLTEARAVIVYSESAIKLTKIHSRSFDLVRIDRVDAGDRKVGAFAPKRPALNIVSGFSSVELVFNAGGTTSRLVDAVRDMIEGRMTLVGEDEGVKNAAPAEDEASPAPQTATTEPVRTNEARTCRRLNCSNRGVTLSSDRCPMCEHSTIPLADLQHR